MQESLHIHAAISIVAGANEVLTAVGQWCARGNRQADSRCRLSIVRYFNKVIYFPVFCSQASKYDVIV